MLVMSQTHPTDREDGGRGTFGGFLKQLAAELRRRRALRQRTRDLKLLFGSSRALEGALHRLACLEDLPQDPAGKMRELILRIEALRQGAWADWRQRHSAAWQLATALAQVETECFGSEAAQMREKVGIVTKDVFERQLVADVLDFHKALGAGVLHKFQDCAKEWMVRCENRVKEMDASAVEERRKQEMVALVNSYEDRTLEQFMDMMETFRQKARKFRDGLADR
jgi:hypothetical protein